MIDCLKTSIPFLNLDLSRRAKQEKAPGIRQPRFEKKCDAYMDELFDTWELALNVDDPYLDPAFC